MGYDFIDVLILINVCATNCAPNCVLILKKVINAAVPGASPSNEIVGLARSLKLLDVHRIQLQSHVMME